MEFKRKEEEIASLDLEHDKHVKELGEQRAKF